MACISAGVCLHTCGFPATVGETITHLGVVGPAGVSRGSEDRRDPCVTTEKESAQKWPTQLKPVLFKVQLHIQVSSPSHPVLLLPRGVHCPHLLAHGHGIVFESVDLHKYRHVVCHIQYILLYTSARDYSSCVGKVIFRRLSRSKAFTERDKI